jgi:hypothetical protein
MCAGVVATRGAARTCYIGIPTDVRFGAIENQTVEITGIFGAVGEHRTGDCVPVLDNRGARLGRENDAGPRLVYLRAVCQ